MGEETKEKKIRGKTVALIETAITFILLILALFGVADLREGWKQIGGIYATIFLGSLGIWMTKKAATTISEVISKTKEMIATKNGGTLAKDIQSP